MKFEDILKTFNNDDLKELAEELIKTIPEYFFEVGASSTGKYHPSFALGYGGLYRHTEALCKILNHMFDSELFNFTSRERDLLRIAGIMHDSRKSGNQDDYKKNKYTNFDHPIQAANVVRSFKDKTWNNDEIELIANAIESHMGRWHTDKRSSLVLPVPTNKYQKVLHLADFLASRKDIEIVFGTKTFNDMPIASHGGVMPFGKHEGTPLANIDTDYLKWVIEKSSCKDSLLLMQIEHVLEDRGVKCIKQL